MKHELRLLLAGDAGSTHIETLVGALSLRGISIEIVSGRDPRSSIDVPVHVVSGTGPKTIRVLAMMRAVRQLASNGKFDLVHAHYASSYGLAAAMAGFRPLVVSVWGSDVLAKHARRLPRAPVLRWTLRRATVVGATSDALASAARMFAPKASICVTPFGVDVQRFAPSAEPPCPPFIVVAARPLVLNSGIDVLLRAFQQVTRDMREAYLLIAGVGPDRDDLRRLAHGLGLDASVRFLGLVPHEEMPALLAGSHVAVLPSVGHEGYGVAAVEASASARPVIASRLDGLAEVVSHGATGLLVRPGDADALASSILLLARTPDLRRSMGQAGHRMVEDAFTIERSVDRIADMYDSALRASCV